MAFESRCRISENNIHSYFDFNDDNLIGRGAHGSVYIAEPFELAYTELELPRTLTVVALKVINIKSSSKSSFMQTLSNEITIMKSVNSDHFIKYYGCQYDSINSIATLVMEFFNGSELFDVIESTPPLTILDKLVIFKNIAIALKELHAAKIAHRDLKPENIMVDMETLKIKMLDFGLSCLSNESGSGSGSGIGHCDTRAVGTLNYVDPYQYITFKDEFNEIIPFPSLYDSDLWSFGMIMFASIFGTLYINGAENPAYRKLGPLDTYSYKDKLPGIIINVKLVKVLTSLLSLRTLPQRRPRINVIIDALTSAIFEEEELIRDRLRSRISPKIAESGGIGRGSIGIGSGIESIDLSTFSLSLK